MNIAYFLKDGKKEKIVFFSIQQVIDFFNKYGKENIRTERENGELIMIYEKSLDKFSVK